jgi:hypothetical protein
LDLSIAYHYIRPGAKVKDALKNCVRDCTAIGPQDHVVIMGSTNDISRNETINCMNTLKTTLSALTSTNVVVLNIPAGHDLVKESIYIYKNVTPFVGRLCVMVNLGK